jgi:hypothetical protein
VGLKRDYKATRRARIYIQCFLACMHVASFVRNVGNMVSDKIILFPYLLSFPSYIHTHCDTLYEQVLVAWNYYKFSLTPWLILRVNLETK